MHWHLSKCVAKYIQVFLQLLMARNLLTGTCYLLAQVKHAMQIRNHTMWLSSSRHTGVTGAHSLAFLPETQSG
jgi:hypothetical protein